MSGPETRLAALLPPYALAMGMEVERVEAGTPVIAFDFADRALGRPGYLHGGAIGGLLEMAAMTALRAALVERGGVRLKPVNVTVEYLRGGRVHRTYAKGRVVRAGRRVAYVTAEAWQDDRTKLIATALMNVLLVEG
jgi:uncharacterized protein (TIGR00369 family)